MAKTHFNRIVTRTENNPITDKPERMWFMSIVLYDEATPIYASDMPFKHKYHTLTELIANNKHLSKLVDMPILDIDNNLQIFDADEIRTVRQGL